MIMRRTVVSALATLLATASLTLSAYAQQSSTAFTYQGFLRDGGRPANGIYDFRFALYDDATGGNQIGSVVFVENVTVADGLFTVEVDFGTAPFNTGARRWIEIGVRPGNNTGGHSLLTPRIELTPVPYALYAQNVANNAVTANQLANDANSLSKVSGGALSITDNGFLKQGKHVYFWARRPKYYGSDGNRQKLLPTALESRPEGWYPISFQDIVSNTDGVVDNNDANTSNPDAQNSGAVFVAPTSGYYIVNALVLLENYKNLYGGALGIQKWDGSQSRWITLQSSTSYGTGSTVNNTFYGTFVTNSLNGIYHLSQGDRLRFVVYKIANRNVITAPTFLPEQVPYFNIYLLSAADAPSN